MIYTVTFNPSIDYIVSVDDFTPGAVNRTTAELLFAGGKGINVSMVLKNLGIESTALGFAAGFTGDKILSMLEEKGIDSQFVRVNDGMSRINVKLRSFVTGGEADADRASAKPDEESEINGMGPAIGKDDIRALYSQLDELKDGDILVLAGSIPSVMPESMYSDIMKYLKDRDIKIVVDATKDLLMNVLEYKPFMIKPNNHEMGEIFGVTLKTKDDVVPYARKLQEKGARNVLISMAGEGALLVDENGKVYDSKPPKGEVKNSVGAGDSMVAGFIAGYIESEGSYEDAFYMGLCTGSASAFSDELADREAVNELLKQVR